MECELPNPALIWARTIVSSLTLLNIADVSDVRRALRELTEYVHVHARAKPPAPKVNSLSAS
ncbi:hypothetical protein ABZ319_09640 [Nocardia sp. NPDC005978]|uniref:hypothetical protein n=1 Tax=Nocardia sp. NPDC005978 TaxID=3156725 RepID=UPI0033BA8C49